MSRSSIALSNLRAVVIIIVLAFHSVLPYLASLSAAAYPFDRAFYQWLAFPIVDNERWFGFDLFCAWQDLGLMTLMLFLSGLFVSSSLARKGSWKFLSEVRNIMECLKSIMRPPVGCQAWELDDAEKAEKLIRNLARRLDQQWPGVAASILEGLDEILTVVRLKLPKELRRSLACTNIAENVMGHHSPRHAQRQKLARCRYGLAMGRGGHDRGQQGLPAIEGAQAIVGSACGPSSSPRSRASAFRIKDGEHAAESGVTRLFYR